MNSTAPLIALAAALLTGQAGAQSVEARLFAPASVQVAPLSKAALIGFWKGSVENSSGNLHAYSARMEIHFGSDGKFESRKSTTSPTIFDDSLLVRKDQWKGSWNVDGDSLVLKIETCLTGGTPLVETCGYLEETDSLLAYAAGLPMTLSAQNEASKFSIPSLASSGKLIGKDRAWALGLGKSSVVYPEPALEADARGYRRSGALAGLFLPSADFDSAN